jgi:hypothetical protein
MRSVFSDLGSEVIYKIQTVSILKDVSFFFFFWIRGGKEQRMNERQGKMQQKPERFTPVRTSHFTLMEMTGYSFGARFIATFQNVDLPKKGGGGKRKNGPI